MFCVKISNVQCRGIRLVGTQCGWLDYTGDCSIEKAVMQSWGGMKVGWELAAVVVAIVCRHVTGVSSMQLYSKSS